MCSDCGTVGRSGFESSHRLFSYNICLPISVPTVLPVGLDVLLTQLKRPSLVTLAIKPMLRFSITNLNCQLPIG